MKKKSTWRMTLNDLKATTVARVNQDTIRRLEQAEKESGTGGKIPPTEWMWGQLVDWSLKSGHYVVREHQFSDTRLFRFDFAVPEKKIGIEYEGLMSEKSGHTTLNGYTKDTEKYNLAATEGWQVIRFTIKNYKNVIERLNALLQ